VQYSGDRSGCRKKPDILVRSRVPRCRGFLYTQCGPCNIRTRPQTRAGRSWVWSTWRIVLPTLGRLYLKHLCTTARYWHSQNFETHFETRNQPL